MDVIIGKKKFMFVPMFLSMSMFYFLGDMENYQRYMYPLPLVLANLFFYHILYAICAPYVEIDTGPCWYPLEAVLAITFCSLVLEVMFYLTHRFILHSQVGFKWIHHIHHELHEPIGLGALYVHPVEFALCNFLPAMMGPLILGQMHHITAQLYEMILALVFVSSHAGKGDFFNHYDHHQHPNRHFGAIGLMDFIFFRAIEAIESTYNK